MSAIRKRHRRREMLRNGADDSLIEEKMREAVFLNLTVMSSEDLEKAKKSKQKDVSESAVDRKRKSEQKIRAIR